MTKKKDNNSNAVSQTLEDALDKQKQKVEKNDFQQLATASNQYLDAMSFSFYSCQTKLINSYIINHQNEYFTSTGGFLLGSQEENMKAIAQERADRYYSNNPEARRAQKKEFAERILKFNNFKNAQQDIQATTALLSFSNDFAKAAEKITHKYRKQIDSFLGRELIYVYIDEEGRVLLELPDVENEGKKIDLHEIMFKNAFGSNEKIGLNVTKNFSTTRIEDLKQYRDVVTQSRNTTNTTILDDFQSKIWEVKNKTDKETLFSKFIKDNEIASEKIPDFAELYFEVLLKSHLTGTSVKTLLNKLDFKNQQARLLKHNSEKGILKGDKNLADFFKSFTQRRQKSISQNFGQFFNYEFAIKYTGSGGFSAESIVPTLRFAINIIKTKEKNVEFSAGQLYKSKPRADQRTYSNEFNRLVSKIIDDASIKAKDKIKISFKRK